MNFADAIRQAAKNAAAAPKSNHEYAPLDLHPTENAMNQQPEFQPENNPESFDAAAAPAFEVATPSIEPISSADYANDYDPEQTTDFAVDAVTSAPVAMPEAPTMTVKTGNVVRLELFLSPEQMSHLFRSMVATQHAMLTLREAAQYLRVHPSTVEHMATEGQLPGLLIEGRWRFPKTSLDEWLNIQIFKKGEANAA